MKSDIKLKVEFLGTGTSQGVPVVACDCDVCRSADPKDTRLRSALFVEANGHKIVIDAGPDFRQQMLRIGLRKLDAIFLTHEHTDHIFGLDDIRAFNWVQKHPTDIYAEKRVQNSIKRVFDYVFEENKYPGIPQMNLHLVENKPFSLNGIEVIPVRGFHHKLPVFGFRLGAMAYLTDVNRVEPEEQQKLLGLDVLIVNALRFEKHISHFNLEEALELIDRVKPKRAYLTHVSHLMGKHEDVQQQLPGHVSLAYDGLKLEL
ncbi:MBL fold metallo-hydrolase [uncultured Sunxiuqinia sp.]|uniref:MBL fold metallo-hydrolase n=1 Tax=uncultured Sunxiuqinia sp. TaxID=1573825 RepID=UPI002628DA68|nr:MBL fold metallo-hydrolase [uncultured Sunxiuqinia sp.]